MLWSLGLLLLAISWIVHRFFSLVSVPITDLIKALDIDIPKATRISIDNITDQRVYIHWELPSTDERIVNFILFVNGRKTSILNGTESHCFISNLLPNKKYKLDLICINNRGFKAKSDSIYIRTKSTDIVNYPNKLLLEDPENLLRILTDNKADLSTIYKVSNLNGESRTTRSRSNTVNSLNNENTTINASINGLPDPKTMENIEELRYYLEYGQEELHNVLQQQEQCIVEFKEQEAMLIDERDKLRERKKLEDGNRQAMRSEIKMLDDSRRLTEIRKSKQENLLISKRKQIIDMTNELNEWNMKVDEFEENRIATENSEEQIYNDIDNDIEEKRKTTKQIQSDITQIEENLKELNIKKKNLDQIKPKVVKLFKILRDHTDQGGCIDAEGLNALNSLLLLNEEVYSKTRDEINIDIRLEAEWRAQQQREVNHCLKVSKAHDSLKQENKTLKQGWLPQNDSTSLSPPLMHSSLSLSSQNQQKQQFPIPVPSNSSVTNLTYNLFASESSPSLNSLHLKQQNTKQISSLSSFQTSSLWNSYSSPPNNALIINTNGLYLNDEETHEIDTPSVNRFLPRNLIGDDFDLLDTHPEDFTEKKNSISSNNTNNLSPFDNSTVNEKLASNDKSIFHDEFGISSPPSFPLDTTTPSSPSQSFQNEFLSAQNSPITNEITNEIHSILSGGTSNQLSPVLKPENTHKPIYLNSLSPRRLSNVFNFGNKPKNSSNDDDKPVSSPLKLPKHQSKFFHKSGSSKNSSGDSHQPFFMFNHTDNNNGTHGTFNAMESLWQGTPLKNTPHKRDVSISSSNSAIEKDNESWAKFHFGHSKHPSEVNSSSKSISKKDDDSATDRTDNIQDYTGDDGSSALGDPVALINTNKSSNTVNSSKSSEVPSSPSFFRKKIFNFGNINNNSNNNQSPSIDKSPTKTKLQNQNRDEQNDESAIDENSTTSGRKLFSRNRKVSITSNRKQSNSSSFEENTGLHENGSIQSNSTSKSIVRKLSFFSSKSSNGGTHKDIEDIIENNEEGESSI